MDSVNNLEFDDVPDNATFDQSFEFADGSGPLFQNDIGSKMDVHNLEYDDVTDNETFDQSFEFADGSGQSLFQNDIGSKMDSVNNLESDDVSDNETFDLSSEFANGSLFQNDIESKSFEIGNIPIDFILSETEVSKTFVVQEDGTLAEVNDKVVETASNEKVLTRKRRRNPTKWKCNVAKSNRQSGKSYKNRKGETRRARNVKTEGCANPDLCPLKCMDKIDMAGRLEIFNSYWNLDDKEKRHFYAANVKRAPCERKRTKAEVTQKPYNFNYHFNYFNVDIEVCQQFFINTLDVNKGRIYYFFSQATKRNTVTPGPATHGKHVKKQLSEAQKQGVRDHINKFPAVESHYCREGSKKLYLDQGLNVSRMYRMYATETEHPVKESAYRNIFDYEFNFSFFRPKKDRCDKCVESTTIKNPSEEKLQEYNLHRARKERAHAERNKDRELTKTVTELVKVGVVPFDLENVFQMPFANASQLFYLRKFGVYVLTVFFNKTVYNVMWNEFNCGREGTHLASALIKGLKEIVLDNPHLEELILWSDSCVPQNRNSYMSAALQDFLKSGFSGKLKQIDHKYSEAGHGEVQEVDNVHSVIENFIRHKFLYSPVSLIKEFRKLQSGKLNFKLLQMTDKDYFDYQSLALASNYAVIPYTKVVHLRYKRNESEISYKLGYEENFIDNNILLKQKHVTQPTLNQLQIHSSISNLKIADLRKMFTIMPEIDRKYYETEIEKLMKHRALTETNVNEISTASNITNEIVVDKSCESFASGKSTSESRVTMTSGINAVGDEEASQVKRTKAAALSKSKHRTSRTSEIDAVSNKKSSQIERSKAKEAASSKSMPRMSITNEVDAVSNEKSSRIERPKAKGADSSKSMPRMSITNEVDAVSNEKSIQIERPKAKGAALSKSMPRKSNSNEVDAVSNEKSSRIERPKAKGADSSKSMPRMSITNEVDAVSNEKSIQIERPKAKGAALSKSMPRKSNSKEVDAVSNEKSIQIDLPKAKGAASSKSMPRMSIANEVDAVSNEKSSRMKRPKAKGTASSKSMPRTSKTNEIDAGSNKKTSQIESPKATEVIAMKSIYSTRQATSTSQKIETTENDSDTSEQRSKKSRM